MNIIDKRNTYVEVEDILAGKIFENEVGIYLKIIPFDDCNNDECNCVDLITNEVRYIDGEAKIMKGAFIVGEN